MAGPRPCAQRDAGLIDALAGDVRFAGASHIDHEHEHRPWRDRYRARVVRDGSRRRQSTFCQQAIPLGDCGGRLVGEVQPAYDLAALPTSVRGFAARPSSEEQCGAWRIHSPWTSTVSTSICCSGGAGVFQLGDQLRDAAIFAAREDIDGLFVLERLDGAR
jgi:hypothetical protein